MDEELVTLILENHGWRFEFCRPDGGITLELKVTTPFHKNEKAIVSARRLAVKGGIANVMGRLVDGLKEDIKQQEARL